ncbi:NCS2 family permease [candidate division KSB1 bacterium]
MLEKFFKLSENNTSVRTEAIGGLTTFMTMAYIIFVQPSMLSQGGMDFGAVMMATCISAAIGTLIMGIYANYPIALAPGMGENVFFTYSVILGLGVMWQQALGVVFISGVLFFLLTIFKIREKIMDSLSVSLKNAIAVGIGLLIAVIGLADAGIIKNNPAAIATLGDIGSKPAVLAVTGIVITLILYIRRIKGAILIGMLLTAIIGIPMGVVKYHGIVSMPPSITPTLFKLEIVSILNMSFVSIIVVFLFMDVLDTIGTLVGVSEQAGFIKDNKLPRAHKALMADAVGTMSGALLGTSTITSYIESAAGVEAGSRTGLSSVFTGLLFLFAIFFYPLVQAIGGGYQIEGGTILYPVIAPALILVGAMMMKNVGKIKWDDLTESLPSFLIIIGMPLTYSPADGLAFGFIVYPVCKLAAGRGKEITWFVYLMAALFLARYVFFRF